MTCQGAWIWVPQTHVEQRTSPPNEAGRWFLQAVLMPLAPDARTRVMEAADAVETSHPREAAILGGIVRSAIDTERLDREFVRSYTRDIIGEFNLVNVDRQPPGTTEIAMVLTRFEAAYGRPLSA